jgi:hypothetical protein
MEPVSLATAFVLTQLLLLALVFLGAFLLKSGELRPTVYQRMPALNLYGLVAGFTLLTLALLVFSEDMLSISRPVFGDLQFPSISKSHAFLIVFLADLFGAAILIRLTGGSLISPFSPILFVLPALAIFLREPPGRFLTYAGLTAYFFIQAGWGLTHSYIQNNRMYRLTFYVVTLGCLAISTMVGYVTRPV